MEGKDIVCIPPHVNIYDRYVIYTRKYDAVGNIIEGFLSPFGGYVCDDSASSNRYYTLTDACFPYFKLIKENIDNPEFACQLMRISYDNINTIVDVDIIKGAFKPINTDKFTYESLMVDTLKHGYENLNILKKICHKEIAKERKRIKVRIPIMISPIKNDNVELIDFDKYYEDKYGFEDYNYEVMDNDY